MTEKVKVTREQAEAIENYKGNTDKMLGLMTYFVNHKHQFNGIYKSLKDIPLEDFARILYQPDSYEVEESFKVGDWVVWETEHERLVLRIESVETRKLGIKVFNADEFHMGCIKRHATPEEIKAEKERRVWSGIGREVGEFRIGDVVQHNFSNKLYKLAQAEDLDRRFMKIEGARVFYEGASLTGFYPAESFISFEQEAETNA